MVKGVIKVGVIFVKFVSVVCMGFFYVKCKNLKKMLRKFEFVKYDFRV